MEIITYIMNLLIKFFTNRISKVDNVIISDINKDKKDKKDKDNFSSYITNLKNLHLLTNLVLLLISNKLDEQIDIEFIKNKKFIDFYLNLIIYTKETNLLYFTLKSFNIFEIIINSGLKNVKQKTSKFNSFSLTSLTYFIS